MVTFSKWCLLFQVIRKNTQMQVDVFSSFLQCLGETTTRVIKTGISDMNHEILVIIVSFVNIDPWIMACYNPCVNG